MVDQGKETEVKTDSKSIETKQTSDPSITVSQKGKNTRNIPAVLFIVNFL